MFENFSIISLAPSDKTYIQITGPSVMLEEILIKSLEPSFDPYKLSILLHTSVVMPQSLLARLNWQTKKNLH